VEVEVKRFCKEAAVLAAVHEDTYRSITILSRPLQASERLISTAEYSYAGKRTQKETNSKRLPFSEIAKRIEMNAPQKSICCGDMKNIINMLCQNACFHQATVL